MDETSAKRSHSKTDLYQTNTPDINRDATRQTTEPSGLHELPEELVGPERRQAQAALAFLDQVKSAQRENPSHPPNQHSFELPTAIGRYKILRSLGRGGFAEVFLAEDPDLNRRVALKIPLFNAAINEVSSERFVREAQLASSLGHPQIIPVYEYGQLGQIRFIAFAWCEGPTLGKWFEENRPLDIRMAAKIIERLAQAVQHAHQRGVIHRDLKPDNILVDTGKDLHDQPIWERVRIADFGLARSLDDYDSRLTQDGQLVGTPAYMAPEQTISSEPINEAVDIWALGMILFELLTGELPFRRPDLLATIKAVEAETAPAAKALRREVPAPLNAIIARCLNKSPADRYPSAHALATDLQRFLNGEPVEARRTTSLMKLGMWTKRNPGLAIAGSVAFLSLALGFVTTAWQFRQAKANLTLAEKSLAAERTALAKAERVAGLFAKTYRRATPGLDGRQLKVVDMLAATAEQIRLDFQNDAPTRWELLHELASTYEGLGVYEPAIQIWKEIYQEQLDSDDPISESTLQTTVALQSAQHSMAAYDKSGELAEAAARMAEELQVTGILLARVHEAEGLVLEHQNKPADAKESFLKAISLYDSEGHPLAKTLRARTLLASTQRSLGEYSAAAEWLDEFVPLAIEECGEKKPAVITLIQEYASILMKLQRYDETITILEKELELSNEVLGPQHGRTLQIKSNLASTFVLAGRRREAIRIYREVVAAAIESSGPTSPHSAVPRYLLGNQLLNLGEFGDAEAQLSEAYEVLKSSVGIANPWTRKTNAALSSLWLQKNDADAWRKAKVHFLSRADEFESLTIKNGKALANVARIEAGQAMIRVNELSEGIELIMENLNELLDSPNSSVAIGFYSSILAALISQEAFPQSVSFAQEYLDHFPSDSQPTIDFVMSRVFAAAISLQTETEFSISVLNEFAAAADLKLNIEQEILLSDCIKILEAELSSDGSSISEHRDTIQSLSKLLVKSQPSDKQ